MPQTFLPFAVFNAYQKLLIFCSSSLDVLVRVVDLLLFTVTYCPSFAIPHGPPRSQNRAWTTTTHDLVQPVCLMTDWMNYALKPARNDHDVPFVFRNSKEFSSRVKYSTVGKSSWSSSVSQLIKNEYLSSFQPSRDVARNFLRR